MTHDEALERAASHLDDLLNIPRQVWLLGAGISKDAGVPLMYDLTTRVESLLSSQDNELGIVDTVRSSVIYERMKDQLPESAHVEHVLSQIGDLVSLAERKKESSVEFGDETITGQDLRSAHRHIQHAIRYTVEFGYMPASEGKPERIGKPDESIVDRRYHDRFVSNLFKKRRAGLEHNPAVRFVTTNYDTLLEDALAHAHIGYVDGFSGGATGFWDPRRSDSRLKHASTLSRHTASICKLHGSIDWIADEADVVMRVRSSVIKADGPEQQLLIYPQATKYQVTQRDPFATLFAEFRSALASQGPTVLVICGYSFGDDHVNEEIERALRTGGSTLTVVALCRQATDKKLGTLGERAGLPSAVADWLVNPRHGDRVVAVGSHGYYRNGLESSVPFGNELPWWSFSGISDFLSKGVEAVL